MHVVSLGKVYFYCGYMHPVELKNDMADTYPGTVTRMPPVCMSSSSSTYAAVN